MPVSRRQVVAAGLVAVAGCSGGDTSCQHTTNPAPVALDGTKQCDVCGMVIAQHPGPNGQLFYCDHSPEGHGNPAWFDALNPGLFQYYYQQRSAGWSVVRGYVTDYSTVDYEVYTEAGTDYITSATASDSFAGMRSVTYVVDSGVHGAMAEAFVPFSVRADAQSFRDEHGGSLRSFDEIDRSMLAR